MAQCFLQRGSVYTPLKMSIIYSNNSSGYVSHKFAHKCPVAYGIVSPVENQGGKVNTIFINGVDSKLVPIFATETGDNKGIVIFEIKNIKAGDTIKVQSLLEGHSYPAVLIYSDN